jgi:uncharacterized BrkB/YihY/UPF0761 family membrane protein
MLTIAQFFTLPRKSASAWNTDDASSMGAALAFYTLFSIAPLWIGAAVTAVLFEIGKVLLGLLGAEFTRVYAYREGSRADEEPPAPPPQRQGRPIKPPKSR